MKHYLEFIDGASCKFWEVEIVDSNVNVRFGKIGTAGQSSVKSFASAADAQKEANKLMAAKIKKGYTPKDAPTDATQAKGILDAKKPVAKVITPNTAFRFVTKKEFEEQYEETFESDCYESTGGTDYYIVCDGDATIADSFFFNKKIPGVTYPDSIKNLENGVVYIGGNLTIEGSLINSEEYGPFLWVGGDLTACDIMGGNSGLTINGNTTASGVYIGYYNDGTFECNGNIKAKLYFDEGHDTRYENFEVMYGNKNGLYNDKEFAALRKKGVVLKGVYFDDDDHEDELIAELLIKGKPVLTPEAYAANYSTLDISPAAPTSTFATVIKVEKAGTLAKQMNDQITELKIVGTLDQRDFKAIRKLKKTLISIDLSEISNSEIPESTFEGFIELKEVILPKELKIIGSFSFNKCKKLEAIAIPDGVTSIPDQAFSDCSSLVAVMFPKELTEIQNSAFQGCKKLANIDLPSTLTQLEGSAFEGCNSITDLVIPDSVTQIGTAFNLCAGVKSVKFPANITELTGLTNCQISSFEVPSTVLTIGSGCFSHWKKLTSIVIPENVTEIKSGAFGACYSLTTIELPSTLTSIDEFVIERCAKLQTIICHAKNVPEISKATFSRYNRFGHEPDKAVPENVVLKVPAESVAAYKADPLWAAAFGEGANIEAICINS